MQEILSKTLTDLNETIGVFKTDVNQRLEKTANDHKALNERFESTITEICQKMDCAGDIGTQSSFGNSSRGLFKQIHADAGLAALRNRTTKGATIVLEGTSLAMVAKALTGDGQVGSIDVPAQRDPRLGEMVGRALTVFDVLPRMPVTSNSFEFNQLDSYTNAAAYQATEGALKAETTMPTSLQSAPITTIAHFLKASEQVLADSPALEQQIRSLLNYGVLGKASSEIIAGATAGKITGLATVATAYAAAAGTALADAIGGAITALDTMGWRAGLVLMHPTDWFAIRSERTATEKAYVAAGWSTAGQNTIWGVPVVTEPSVVAGSPIVLDPAQVAILDRQQPVVEIGRDGDDFTKNLVTIRGELRIGLAVFSPSAVLKVAIAA